MKKRIIAIISILLFVTTLVYYNVGTFKVGNNRNFKNVYSSKKGLENIKIYVYNIRTGKQTLVKDVEDVSFILENVEKTRVKIKRIPSGEVLLGGACRFIIENTNKNISLNLNIQYSQISINDRAYKMDSDIYEAITNITKKYDKDAIG